MRTLDYLTALYLGLGLLPASQIAHAVDCGRTEMVKVEGREFLTGQVSYEDAKEAAKQTAVRAAIQEVNPSGYTSLLSGQFDVSTDSAGRTNESISMKQEVYERVRGMAKSVAVNEERIESMGSRDVLVVSIDVEVCVEDLQDSELVVQLREVIWLDGNPSSELLRDALVNFPINKRVVAVGPDGGRQYRDVEVSGKVDGINYQALVKKTIRGREEVSPATGRYLAPGEKELLEISVRIRVLARILASHQVFEVKRTLVSQMEVTDDANWDRNRQYRAKQMLQVAFKNANAEVVSRIINLN